MRLIEDIFFYIISGILMIGIFITWLFEDDTPEEKERLRVSEEISITARQWEENK